MVLYPLCRIYIAIISLKRWISSSVGGMYPEYSLQDLQVSVAVAQHHFTLFSLLMTQCLQRLHYHPL